MQNFVELLKDHALILASTKALTAITRADVADPDAASAELGHLARLLDAHLAAEAEFITADEQTGYPEFGMLAAQHGIRFNDLVLEWATYLQGWTLENIRNDWQSFVWATDWMVERLNEQVDAENEALYPAALRYGLIRLLPKKSSAIAR